MKKFNEKLLIILFICIIILPTILWGVYDFVSVINPSLQEIIEEDIDENRNLSKFPATFSNAYGSEIDSYYNDHLPFRSKMIVWNRDFNFLFEEPFAYIKNKIASFLYSSKNEEEIEIPVIRELTKAEKYKLRYIGDIDYEAYSFLKDDIIYDVSNEYLEPRIYNNGTILGRNDWLFYFQDNYLNYYKKNNILSTQEMDKYVDLLSKINDKCIELGKQFFVFVPPNKSQVYPEFMPSYDVNPGLNRIETLREYIATSSNVNFIYPKEELVEAKQYLNVYKRYDTHWNEAGGFIGAMKVYDFLDKDRPPIASSSFVKLNNSLYDLVNVGNLDKTRFNDEYEYHLEYPNQNYLLESITEGNTATNPYIYSKSTSDDKRDVCLIGDSFRFYMGNTMQRDFEEVYILHRDAIGNIDKAKEAIRNSDIIIFEVLERLSDFLLIHGETLLYILDGTIP
ncbi:MAG: hypothetical protein Q4F88_04430 [Eubacteriales bacterium]|nr:hypothetical protein [Eubacteriales bacterium]